jgi:PAS domain S-box-containing protein
MKIEDDSLKSAELFRQVMETSMDAILITIPDGTVLYANNAACVMFGMTEEEIIKLGRNGLVDLNDKRLDDLLHHRKINGSAKGELTFKRKNGEKFQGEVSSSIFYNKKGEARTSMVIRDITSQKRLEKELLEANKNMEEMLYVASHDLQSPLLSMEGYSTELLHDYASILDEEGVYCLERLHANAHRMHKLVISLLDMSRLNTVKLEKSEIGIGVIIQNILTDLSLIIEQKDVNFSIEKMPVIYADEKRMETAIRNIIINAMNYGCKNLKISFKNNTLAFADDGIGIPPDQVERIFKPGERLKKIETDGVGMGLVFCRKVVTQHNGRIWAESKGLNKGATFFIEFDKNSVIQS